LMENVRFFAEEETHLASDPEGITKFRRSLSDLCDVFVNDAFGCLHRGHSSVSGIVAREKAAGLLVERELRYLSPIAYNPGQRISLLVLGGAKVCDKIALVANLIPRTDRIFIGGAMVLTFMSVSNPGFHLGASRIDPRGASHVPAILEAIARSGTELVLPTDFVITDSLQSPRKVDVVEVDPAASGVPEHMMAVDIGPRSGQALARLVSGTPDGGVVLWNGPMGVFEEDPFSGGTRALLSALSSNTPRVTTIVGGGDSAAAAVLFGAAKEVSHVSTGGGATLELLEGRVLPGLAALSSPR